MSSDLFFIGIDGGGTKCRARLEDVDGNVLGEGVSGPANIMRDSVLAKASIVDAINIAISNAGNANTFEQISLSQCVVGAGLAGANIESAKQQFEQWQHPFHSLHVLSDLHAACVGAHNGNPGAAIIIGTGSSGTMWQGESFQDVGGHGFPIGDKASGAWLGLKAVQHTLLCLDELDEKDELAAEVCNALQSSCTQEIVAKCAEFNTHHYAALVERMLPLLYTKQNKVTALFEEGALYIERMAKRLLANHNHCLAMIGGLSNVYSAYFSESIKARLVPCKATPQQGAIYHAKAAFNHKEGEK